MPRLHGVDALTATPLAPPSQREDPANATLFESLPPERTGIHFQNPYDRPDRWKSLWRQYFNGSIGSGLAAGDVNGDGLPDLFAVGKDTPNALYLNLGDFRFRDATQSADVAGKAGMGAGCAFVDIDNDGDLDLYVCYVDVENELFLNDGSGYFVDVTEKWGLDQSDGSNAPSFADYDRDGDLDLYLQRNYLESSGYPGGLPDSLYENRGDRFVEVTDAAGIAGEGQGHIALWWDFDEDGWPDVYVANDFEEPDRLYRNNRDGTFTNVLADALVAAPYSAMGADFGDLNNDGHLDLMVAEMNPMDRAYSQRTVGPLSGKLYNTRSLGVNQYMQNMVSLRVGPSHTAEIGFLTGLDATGWTWAPRLADFDNDGRTDVFITNGMPRAFHDADIGVRIAQAKSLAARVALFERSPPLRERNLAFRNLGDLAFASVGSEWGLDLEGVSFASVLADFDRDGDVDIVVGNWQGGLTVYRNASQAGRRVVARLQGVRSNRYGFGARLTLVGGGRTQTQELSLIRGYMASDEPVALFVLPDEGLASRLDVVWPSGARQRFDNLEAGFAYRIEEPDAAGVDGERSEPETLFRRADFHVPPETWSSEEYYQNFKGQPALPFTEDRKGPALAVADLDGDGWKDVVLGGATGQALRVLRNESGRSLRHVGSGAFEEDFEAEDTAVRTVDFDADGDLDLLVASGGVELSDGDEYYRDRLYRNLGDMRFERVSLSLFPAEANSTSRAVAGDFDGDGRVELLSAGGTKWRRYPASEDNVVWRRSADGFVEANDAFARAFATSGRTSDLALVDLDGDGDLDVVQAVEWGAPRVWRNESGELRWAPDALDTDRLSGMWRCIATGDFDGDGLVDFALGNLGLNTKYRVSPAAPGVLYSSDEPELQRKHIEAQTVDGKEFPRESRLLLQLLFPELPNATGSYENWSRLAIGEIFPAEFLARFERRTLNEPRSMLMLQREGGRFEAVPLPRGAQIGVATSMLAADFDGDGDLDLAVVNESLSPLPSAAVLLERSFVTVLLNRGDGSFEVLWPWKSGIDVPEGQPRHLAWEDLDGDGIGELIVSANEGPLHVFRLGKR